MSRSMVLLVSGQPMANLLAALEPALQVRRVHLIVSGDMEVGGQAGHLAAVLEQQGLSVTTHMISDPFLPDATRTTATSLVKDNPEEFIINVTGGTKPMVLGAYRAALEWGVRDLLYLDHESSLLRWLEGNRPPLPSTAGLKTASILRAHGYEAKGAAGPSRSALQLAGSLHRQLTGDTLSAWNKLFSRVEALCSQKRHWTGQDIPLQTVFLRDTEAAQQLLDTPLRESAAMGFCSYSDSRIRVERHSDNQLLCGGWFELVVYDALHTQQQALGLDELSLNLKVQGADGASNEFDCVARRDNRLIFLEVKTASMTGVYGSGKPQDIFYKLNNLKSAGGLTGRACLVSLAKVNSGMEKRFASAKLGLVHNSDTEPDSLQAALADWITQG